MRIVTNRQGSYARSYYVTGVTFSKDRFGCWMVSFRLPSGEYRTIDLVDVNRITDELPPPERPFGLQADSTELG